MRELIEITSKVIAQNKLGPQSAPPKSDPEYRAAVTSYIKQLGEGSRNLSEPVDSMAEANEKRAVSGTGSSVLNFLALISSLPTIASAPQIIESTNVLINPWPHASIHNISEGIFEGYGEIIQKKEERVVSEITLACIYSFSDDPPD